MKKNVLLTLCFAALGVFFSQTTWAAKPKKESKPYEWKMPALTGNADFDQYLLKCDTINTRISSYCNDITFYQMRPVVVTENGQEGEQEFDRQWCMIDPETNTLRSSNAAFKQNLDIILSYPMLVLEMTSLATYTASATTALPNLGLKSVSYAKYLKAGPKMIAAGGAEMKKIYKAARAQAKQIKDLKAGKVDDDYARNAEVEASSVDAGSASMATLISTQPVYLAKSSFEQQMGEVKKQDAAISIDNYDIPEEVE